MTDLRTAVAVGLSALALSMLAACGTPTSQVAQQPVPSQAPSSAPTSQAEPSSAPSSTAPSSTAPSSTAPSSSAPASPAPSTSAPSSTAPSTTAPSTTAPSTTAPSTTTPSPTAPAKPPALMATGATGEQVRDLQVRLRSIGWFAGTITGSYATTTVDAVKGFQAKRGLAESGEVDQTTWDRLTAMTKAPTDDEKHNVLRPGPALLKTGQTSKAIKELQARLAQLDWFSEKVTGYYGPATVAAVKGFQDKRGIPVTGEVDQRTIDRLTAMTHEPTAVELGEKAPEKPKSSKAELDKRCLTGRVICISKTTRSIAWVVDGKVELTMDARFGREGMETREGTFQVGWKSKNHTSTIYHTWMPYAMFFSGGQAVHYSPDFAANGYNGGSHGCVNIRNRSGIEWLFDEVRVGDKVVVYW